MHLPPLAEQSQGMGVPMKTEDQVNQERLQKYRLLRQQELLRDAAKLHQLSGELQYYLDKNGSAILSLDMLKPAVRVSGGHINESQQHRCFLILSASACHASRASAQRHRTNRCSSFPSGTSRSHGHPVHKDGIPPGASRPSSFR